MRVRQLHWTSTLVVSTSIAVVLLGAAPAARAAKDTAKVAAKDAGPKDTGPKDTGPKDSDPFAEPPSAPASNVSEPSKQAPASAPAPSDANFPTGLVERLPFSAYPEPVIRGLYGSSLWLDMQGHQFPYYPRIGVGVSGYAWNDLSYKLTRIGDPAQSDHTTKLFSQGRFALRLTPTYTNGEWFVQAQAELIGSLETLNVPNAPLTAQADDLWVRTGVWKKWDVTVGRFEAFPVYHLGMGLDLHTDERIGAYDAVNLSGRVPQPYLASYLYYRPVGPQNVAFHLYPGSNLRIELLGQWGSDALINHLGARPALIYDLGWFKFRVAAEYQWRFPQDPAAGARNESKNRGVAGSVQFVLAPWIEFGPNIGVALTDVWVPNVPDPDPAQSGDIVSYGGFLNARPIADMLIGLGGNFASFTNLHMNADGTKDRSTNSQYFVALQYLVRRQLFVKLVGGYAKTRFDDRVAGAVPYDDDAFNVRLRLMYLY
jgi:hypothetical protein